MSDLKIIVDLNDLWDEKGYTLSDLIKGEVEREVRAAVKKHLKSDKKLQSAIKKAATEAATKTMEAITNANP